jgi:predicted lysophospholipase L1 biosynthesis ABC-type transport system permease subunit
MRIDDETEPAATVKAAEYDVDPSFFETMGIPLLAGRGLVRGGPAGEAVVDDAFVRKFFPDTDPLGHRFAFGSSGANVHEIVGVARQVRGDLSETPVGDPIFMIYAQLTPTSHPLSFVVRLDDLGHMASLTQMVREVAATCVVRTDVVDERYARLYGDTALAASVASGFGALAFLVATAGVYGVMAFLVAGRRREIGIRLALGADRPDIQRLVFGASLRYVVLGVAAGLVGAALVGRLVESQLFGVTVTDPLTYAIVAASTLAAALFATWHPALQAARVDPAVTLRAE